MTRQRPVNAIKKSRNQEMVYTIDDDGFLKIMQLNFTEDQISLLNSPDYHVEMNEMAAKYLEFASFSERPRNQIILDSWILYFGTSIIRLREKISSH